MLKLTGLAYDVKDKLPKGRKADEVDHAEVDAARHESKILTDSAA